VNGNPGRRTVRSAASDPQARTIGSTSAAGAAQDLARYVRGSRKRTQGQKINPCCRLAKGEVVCHWDDDDWSAPTRMEEQVSRLYDAGVSVTGYDSMLCFDERTGRALEYCGRRGYACGTSLCYTRAYWQKHRFLPIQVGSDNFFVATAESGDQLCTAAGGEQMVFRVRSDNSSPKFLDIDPYREVALTRLPEGFRRCL
jgi:hypothetical protein